MSNFCDDCSCKGCDVGHWCCQPQCPFQRGVSFRYWPLEILAERKATWDSLIKLPLVKRKMFWVQNFRFNILAVPAKAKHWAILGSLNSCPKFPLLSIVVNGWPEDIRTHDLWHAILSSNLFNVLFLGQHSLVVLSSLLFVKICNCKNLLL